MQLTAMPPNYDIAEKPVRAIQRRKAGETWWKNVINDLIESEKDDLRELRDLRDRTRDMDTMRLICTLLARKTERVIELTQLLHYKDTDRQNGSNE